MKDPVLQAIETAKWCDDAVLDPTIKTPTMTYIHGANKQIEAIRSAYIAERQRLEQRIAELERDKVSLEYAIDTYALVLELKDKRIDKLYERITKLKRLLVDAVLFIAYAQSHGGEAIAKEIEENLNQEG